MNESTVKKIERLLKGKEYQELSRNGQPAWTVRGCGAYFLDGNKIKRATDLRALIERGYSFKSEKGVVRGWQSTMEDVMDRRDVTNRDKQDDDCQQANYEFWIMGKRMCDYHGPSRATMLLGSIK